MAMELMLSRHPSECLGCDKYLNCELQSLKQYVGVSEELRVRKHPQPVPLDTGNPLFVRDMGRCILCGRCVRACNELRGIGAISLVGRGIVHPGLLGLRPRSGRRRVPFLRRLRRGVPDRRAARQGRVRARQEPPRGPGAVQGDLPGRDRRPAVRALRGPGRLPRGDGGGARQGAASPDARVRLRSPLRGRVSARPGQRRDLDPRTQAPGGRERRRLVAGAAPPEGRLRQDEWPSSARVPPG